MLLGAGGEYYLGWYCGFFHGLYDHGLDMNAMSEMVVGTSAGSYMGSSLTSGHFLRLRSEWYGDHSRSVHVRFFNNNQIECRLQLMFVN